MLFPVLRAGSVAYVRGRRRPRHPSAMLLPRGARRGGASACGAVSSRVLGAVLAQAGPIRAVAASDVGGPTRDFGLVGRAHLLSWPVTWRLQGLSTVALEVSGVSGWGVPWVGP